MTMASGSNMSTTFARARPKLPDCLLEPRARTLQVARVTCDAAILRDLFLDICGMPAARPVIWAHLDSSAGPLRYVSTHPFLPQ